MPKHQSRYKQIRRYPDFVEAAGLPRDLLSVELIDEDSTPRPIDFFWGKLWGINNNTGAIYHSTDMGETWSGVIATTPLSGIQRIAPCADGEILVMAGYSIRKSVGWSANPATATYVEKAVPTAGGGTFLRWGYDHDITGQIHVLIEYAGGDSGSVEWGASRQVLISSDAGTAFDLVRDTHVLYGESDNRQSHLHAACYDPWSGRIYYTEGHGPNIGLYFTEDLGETFIAHEGSWPELASAPTCLVATEHGIVMGTDNSLPGVYLLPRTADPANTDVEVLWIWHNEINQAGLCGFAEAGYRDEMTGLVYFGYNVNFDGIAAPIICTDGRSANAIYRLTDADEAGDRVWRAIVHAGKMAAVYWKDGEYKHLYGTVSKSLYAPHKTVFDTGNVLRGVVEVDPVFGYGNGDCMAAGDNARAKGNWVSCAGPKCQAVDVVNVVAHGANVIVSGNHSYASGMHINCTVPYAFIQGIEAACSSSFGYASGWQATVTGSSGTAIGQNTLASHDRSIVVGTGVESIAADNFNVGPIDHEIPSGSRGLILRDLQGGRFRTLVNSKGQFVANHIGSGTRYNAGAIAGVENWWDFSNPSVTYKQFDPTKVSADDGDSLVFADPRAGTYAVFGAAFGTPPVIHHGKFNGRQGAYFDGTKQLACGLETNSTTATIFIVMRAEVPTGKFTLMASDSNGSQLLVGDVDDTTFAPDWNSGTPTYRLNGAATDFSTRKKFVDAVNYRLSVVTIENVDLSTWPATNSGVRIGNPGGAYAYNGYLMELIVSDGEMSDSERNGIEQGLIAKYRTELETDAMKLDSAATSTDTGVLVFVGGSWKRITVGAADSGGSGKRALVVAN